jgi:hypothetical protein
MTPPCWQHSTLLRALFLFLASFLLACLPARTLHAAVTPLHSEQEPPLHAAALSPTSFPFQAHLQSSGQPVNGVCDTRFSLYDALLGGSKVAADRFTANLAVTNGLLNTTLDFGDVFGADARWLEVAVRCPAGSGAYTAPRPAPGGRLGSARNCGKSRAQSQRSARGLCCARFSA